MNELDLQVGKRSNRRSFVKNLGIAGAASAALAGAAKGQSGTSDLDILNFALNLEYLEAEFYSVATTGKTIDQFGIGISGSGNAGPTTGGMMVTFTPSPVYTQNIALQLAMNEREHVTYLRNAIMSMGGTPVAKPAINLDALNLGFGSMSEFLVSARAFEDTGVSAYAGAAPLIKNPVVLEPAARILGTEADHAGNIRLQIAYYGIQTAHLDGIDVLPPPSGKNFFDTDMMSLAITRTAGQVLYIVYGAANVTMGGFFPNGVNGTINMSSAPATSGS